MKTFQRGFHFLVVILVVLSFFAGETEARRKVLRGRGTVTRTYYRGLPIPAWSIILICSLGYIVVGGVLYLVLQRFVLAEDEDKQPVYQPPYSPAPVHDVDV